jgi:hypothetical protein
MMTSRLFMAAAVLGQVPTSQPVEQTEAAAPAPRIRVVIPPASQPAVEDAVRVVTSYPAPGAVMPGQVVPGQMGTATAPAPGGPTRPVNIQATSDWVQYGRDVLFDQPYYTILDKDDREAERARFERELAEKRRAPDASGGAGDAGGGA